MNAQQTKRSKSLTLRMTGLLALILILLGLPGNANADTVVARPKDGDDARELAKYPAGSFCNQTVADIYGNEKTGELTILYDRPLIQELKKLEYIPATGQLILVFKGGRIPFDGRPMNEPLASLFKKTKSITLMQMDRKTKKPVAGMVVPLVIIDHPSKRIEQ